MKELLVKGSRVFIHVHVSTVVVTSGFFFLTVTSNFIFKKMKISFHQSHLSSKKFNLYRNPSSFFFKNESFIQTHKNRNTAQNQYSKIKYKTYFCSKIQTHGYYLFQ